MLLVLTAISYHPRFANFVVEDAGPNPLNPVMYVAMLYVFMLFVLRQNFRYCKQMQRLYVLFGIIVITYAMLFFLKAGKSYIYEVKNILIALSFMTVGYQAKLDQKELTRLVIIYGLAVAFATTCQVMFSLGGFTIRDIYMQYGKNTLGVILASESIALGYLALLTEDKRTRWMMYALAAFLFVLMLTIRSRAAYIATVMVVAYLVWKRSSKQQHGIAKLIALGLVLLAFLIFLAMKTHLLDGILRYVYNSFTQNHEDDLTSDRMVRNAAAIELIKQEPVYGNLFKWYHLDMIHNYPLRVTAAYGVFFVLPLLAMYGSICIITLKNLVRFRFNLSYIGFMVILIPLIISMLEPTFPYAPGTGSILSFILFGYSIQQLEIAKRTPSPSTETTTENNE